MPCDNCGREFDPLATRWLCPNCGLKHSCCDGAPACVVCDCDETFSDGIIRHTCHPAVGIVQ